MTEDISVKILTQTSENIKHLFDLTTRIDERVKSMQFNQGEFNNRIESLSRDQNSIIQKVAVLESMDSEDELKSLSHQINDIKKELIALDKRVSQVEGITDNQQDRWKNITSFIVQLVWIVIAAWVLFKLNLNPPPVP